MEARNQPRIRYRGNKQAGVFCSECGQSAIVCGGTHGQRSPVHTANGWTIAGLPTETVLDAVPGGLIIEADRTPIPQYERTSPTSTPSSLIIDEGKERDEQKAPGWTDGYVDTTAASSIPPLTPQKGTATSPLRAMPHIQPYSHSPRKQFTGRTIHNFSRRRGIAVVVALLALISTAVVVPLLLRPARPQVTIRITPVQRVLSQIEQVNAVPTPTTAQEVEARVIQVLSASRSTSARASGKGSTHSLPAYGSLTLTNQASSWQTIPAGSEYTGRSGVIVVTDSAVQVPPVDLSTNPPTLGQATVSAHTKQGGVATDIAVLDINNCCTVGIAVRNLVAFSGGKDGQPYSVLKIADIQVAARPLQQELTIEATAAVRSQVSHTERLVEAPLCSPDIRSDRGDGAHVDSSLVRVTVTCTGEVYQPDQVQALAVARLLKAPTPNAQTNAELRSYAPRIIGKKILRAAISDSIRKTITLTIWIQGVWTRQFNSLQCTWIASHLAGRNKNRAASILSPRNGIAQSAFSWQPDGQGVFPSDPAQITIIVQSGLADPQATGDQLVVV